MSSTQAEHSSEFKNILALSLGIKRPPDALLGVATPVPVKADRKRGSNGRYKHSLRETYEAMIGEVTHATYLSKRLGVNPDAMREKL